MAKGEVVSRQTPAMEQTLRPVELPELPGDGAESSRLPELRMQRARVAGGQLHFDGATALDEALRHGIFSVEIPPEMAMTAGDLFAHNFFRAKEGDELDEFRGYREVHLEAGYEGFVDHEVDQWENFYAERRNWPCLPDGVVRLGEQLSELGVVVLRSVLRHAAVPEGDWPKVTGGVTEGLGHHMLGFNHFRPEKPVRGAKFHRDSGWVTLVRATDPGLVCLVGDRMFRASTPPGHLVVNFGSSMEVLTQQLQRRVHAVVHGVARTERRPGARHRTSYVLFLDSDLRAAIYRYDDEGVAHRVARRGSAKEAARVLARPVHSSES